MHVVTFDSSFGVTTKRNHFGKKQIRSERGLTPGRVVSVKYRHCSPWPAIVVGFLKYNEEKCVILLKKFPSGDFFIDKQFFVDIGILPYQLEKSRITTGWNPTNHAKRTIKSGLCASEAEELQNYYLKSAKTYGALLLKENEIEQFSCAKKIKRILKNSF